MLTKPQIAALIPHHGAMCLLDAVARWDEESIVCSSASHRLPGHPLEVAGRLPALAGVEYAAQAMAVHGALAAGDGILKEGPGVLAGLRDLELHVSRLDDVEADLRIEASLLARQGANLLYSFLIESDARALLQGRAAIALDVNPGS